MILGSDGSVELPAAFLLFHYNKLGSESEDIFVVTAGGNLHDFDLQAIEF